MRLLRSLLGLVLLSASLPWLCAGDPAHPHFLAMEGLKLAELPPPPPDDSPAGRADLETLLQVQADRTPAQVERARRTEKHTAFLMGASVLGPWFTAENLPQTARFFAEVNRQARPLVVQAKEGWHRPRPYVRDSRVQPCLPFPEGLSYPSGHSSSAALWAELFMAAFPEQQAAFAMQARETMWSRVLAGVHFPSDTQAGRLLGESIGKAMLTSPDTREALAAVRAEIEACRQKFLADQAVGASTP
jgi:acid phosphatase (class A)